MTEPPLAHLAARAPELRVQTAAITADLLENSFTEKPLTLEHHITLTFDPIAGAQPILELGPLVFPARSWQQLPGLRWQPPEPEIEEIEGTAELVGRYHGTLRLGDDGLEVTCEHLHFHEAADTTLTATLAVVIDEPVSRRLELPATLEIGPIRVLGDIYRKPRPNLDQALTLARTHLDLDHLKPRTDGEIIVLDPV